MEDYLDLGFRTVLKSQSGSDYTCLQRLGLGGSAETYLMLATAGPLRGQLFAVKIFRRLSKPEWRANFLDEIRFLQGCNHPAVMRVFDEGLYLDQHPFVVAEYLPGTLANVLRTGPLMMAKMGYALQLLSALEYLATEAVAVVHRDIKPANIFIKGGSCVLGDFGLVKRTRVDPAVDREMIRESFGPRMPRAYRTPDLIDYLKGGPPPTDRSDVYQAGLVFAEMFSGRNPQRPMRGDDFTERIELDSFYIPGGMGRPIKELIEPMLFAEPGRRPSAAALLPTWQDLFLEAARRAHALDGRVV
jgi:serine/threonine protein kinase